MIKYDLKKAKQYLDNVIVKLDEAPEKIEIAELIAACQKLDNYYADFCEEIDEEYGDEKGTAYKNGFSLEFYIESDNWHEISLALRRLKL